MLSDCPETVAPGSTARAKYLYPDRADAVMIAYQPSNRGMEIWTKLGKEP
jgi:hypothetical protein